MIIGVPGETYPGERRVALVPDHIPPLISKLKLEVLIQSGAGAAAGYPDDKYTAAGAKLAQSRAEVWQKADIVLQVRTLGANLEKGRTDLELMRKDQVVIGMAEPLTETASIKEQAQKGVTFFALELIPRITRAQAMDVLSSMATVAGYKAVLLAAEALPKMFPMLMTAAGTLTPAKAFVIGAGVAGLQAIAMARRLGAVVQGYDVRPAVKEQVESLGAKFVEMELETGSAETKGGYAQAMGEEFYRKQRELMTVVIAESDLVISTAAVPGKKAPVLITADMVKGMRSGSVIVDLAAERGGNCELTKPGETVVVNGVTIVGPLNLASTVPFHASQMFSKNITNFFRPMIKEGALNIDMEDEVIRETLAARGGEVVLPQLRQILGLEVKKEDGSPHPSEPTKVGAPQTGAPEKEGGTR